MIAYGLAVSCEDTYARFAAPGIRRAWEPDSRVLERRQVRSLFRAYNEMIDEASTIDDLEALVLLHQDTEILDEAFAGKVRRSLVEPDVAVVGAIGAVRVTSLAWGEGSSAHGRVVAPRMPPGFQDLDCGGGRHDVDVVDGLIMVLSPWAVRELRFDESLAPGFHGYDVDFCMQARVRGGRVVVDELAVAHHCTRIFGDAEAWINAYVACSRKWHTRWAAPGWA